MTSPTPTGAPSGGLAVLLGIHPKGQGASDSSDASAPDGTQDEKTPYDIPPPKGFDPPEGAEPGRKFDFTCKGHMTEDGMISIDSIEGIPTGPEDAEDAQEPEEPEDEEAQEPEGGEDGQGAEEDNEPEEDKPTTVEASRKQSGASLKKAMKGMRS